MAEPCASAAGRPEVQAALARIASSVDPCGESAELVAAVNEYRRCGVEAYPICLDRRSQRSFIDQGGRDGVKTTTITWNPELRTELEDQCGGDSATPVLRDPTASLLHELIHAVQDCHGLVPADHEFEAVRIENIYRRANGLCQRTRYGAEPLPSAMVVGCEAQHCTCQRGGGRLLEAALPGQPGGAVARAAEGQGSAGDTESGVPYGSDAGARR